MCIGDCRGYCLTNERRDRVNNYSEFTLGELEDGYETSGLNSACDGDNREVIMGAEDE